jgi:hypothetical protein
MSKHVHYLLGLHLLMLMSMLMLMLMLSHTGHPHNNQTATTHPTSTVWLRDGVSGLCYQYRIVSYRIYFRTVSTRLL